jgi:hypothetical protein
METAAGIGEAERPGWRFDLFDLSARVLVAVTWISGAIFGLYILLFFGGAAVQGAMESWNTSLPGLYDSATPLAVIAIGLHFVTGGVLLLLGPVQFIGGIRRRAPAVHRWLGRAYVLSAALAGVGGIGFILMKGTVGGAVMNVGFGIYGALMVICAERAFTNARQRKFDAHRDWAIRLFALTVGSWLYRMEYGFWHLATGSIGVDNFHGWFDVVMVFFFYVPNLVVAEVFIRSRGTTAPAVARYSAAVVMLAAVGFVVLATWVFTTRSWGPGMMDGVSGALG